jgi:hypothetical protein
VKIRLMGLPDDVTEAIVRLRAVFDVISESPPYPCRGVSREVRVYIEARPADTGGKP